MVLPIYVSRNGVLVQPAQAAISVFNPALYSAYGVYESIQVVNGVVFEQAAHLQRLSRSASLLGLSLPAGLVTFGRWIAEVVAANAAPDCTLRIFVIGPENGGEITAFLWPQRTAVYPERYYTQGADAITFEGQRFLPQAKSLNTLVSFLSRRQAQAGGAHEALLHYSGHLTEGSNSNLFAVLDGILVTPPAEEVLSGVTRDTVIGLAIKNDIPFRQKSLPVIALSRWSECFITSSSRNIMPITVIDGRPVGDGHVGAITARLMALFDVYFRTATDRERPPSQLVSALLPDCS